MVKPYLSACALLLAAALAGCQKVPLLGPSGSTISVSAGATVLAPGASTQISATVVEEGGTPVHDGTVVRFTASLGRLDPPEAETRGGTATTTFIAGTTSGTAQVRATSGAASGGEGETASNVVSIQIGGAAAAAVSVSASPSRVGPRGGTVTIVASVTDGAGNLLPGVPVTFSSDVGTLSASSAVTDSAGDARVNLTTSQQAVVTARVGENSATVTVTVAPAGTVTLTLAADTVTLGTPARLTVEPADNTSPRVVVNWGDGRSDDLGVVATSRTVAHGYEDSGTYTIAAVATADGESFTTTTVVTVNPRPPVSVSVTASPAAPERCEAVTFTATAREGTTDVFASSYRWDIASGENTEEESVTTTGNTLTRVFKVAGRRTITVTATMPDGRIGTGQTQVAVTAAETSCD